MGGIGTGGKKQGGKSQVGNENNSQCIKYEAQTNDDAMCVCQAPFAPCGTNLEICL